MFVKLRHVTTLSDFHIFQIENKLVKYELSTLCLILWVREMISYFSEHLK